MTTPPTTPPTTRPTNPGPFDICGELPTGTTLLEASAGTGKTWTIGALVTRYVAEGEATMDELLVVSFSRESTRELRGRVRERLVSARDGLHAPPAHDAVLQHLAACDAAELDRRHRQRRHHPDLGVDRERDFDLDRGHQRAHRDLPGQRDRDRRHDRLGL